MTVVGMEKVEVVVVGVEVVMGMNVVAEVIAVTLKMLFVTVVVVAVVVDQVDRLK